MENLCEKMLIDTYFLALEFDLEKGFIVLLEEEINRRGIGLFEIHRYRRNGEALP